MVTCNWWSGLLNGGGGGGGGGLDHWTDIYRCMAQKYTVLVYAAPGHVHRLTSPINNGVAKALYHHYFLYKSPVKDVTPSACIDLQTIFVTRGSRQLTSILTTTLVSKITKQTFWVLYSNLHQWNKTTAEIVEIKTWRKGCGKWSNIRWCKIRHARRRWTKSKQW